MERPGDRCEFCERYANEREEEYQHVVQAFSLRRGPPTNAAGRASLRKAEQRMRELFKRKGGDGRFDYPPEDLLESHSWWYIPYRGIGCNGHIVDKKSGYVNWLGSGVRLSDCFWGHDRGLYCDLVDFTFDVNTDTQLAMRLLPLFKHTHAVGGRTPPSEPVWYRKSELESEFASQFPTFRRHFVWPHIPVLRRAYEHEGLRFSCCVSKGA
jgi:hypothetical protein